MATFQEDWQDSLDFQLSLLRLTQKMQDSKDGREATRRAGNLLAGLITKSTTRQQ